MSEEKYITAVRARLRAPKWNRPLSIEEVARVAQYRAKGFKVHHATNIIRRERALDRASRPY